MTVRNNHVFALMMSAALLLGCSPPHEEAAGESAPYVRVVQPRAVAGRVVEFSGTIRARVEAPLAFQVGGRIVSRAVDAGQMVRAGQVLLSLDTHDLALALESAEAEQAAATSALANAEAELRRVMQLQKQNFISEQAVERAALQRREAQSGRDAASARQAQARNALGYAALKAPADGILIEVTGEPGQVVTAGQTVAQLAQGAREVEVFFPEAVTPPATGQLSLPGGATELLRLREVSGALDPLGRTRRARYTVADGGDSLALGSVVNARFDLDSDAAADVGAVAPVFSLPLGALDERGRQPQVWRVHNGQVVPVPVHVLAMDDRQARVQGQLSLEDRVVALGTHLLRDGLAVRVKEAK